ncbi:tyrosine-protein phosphatase non-receptor type 1 isoform X2 [Brienomyrus brachyistius]|uniref:tyrosine-protein phosphatase non-receptor type 1 isoform X2 n=1 Tax=Brienomyrus brachyistius TaxID=42636 RepID=UPI0020B41BD8|nr:tyrosine-protein phosphatase non-receptor type 1 isoform X2 [Brienomyrus brachyistius]
MRERADSILAPQRQSCYGRSKRRVSGAGRRGRLSEAMEEEFREIDGAGTWNAIYQEIRLQSSELPCKVAKLSENKSRNRYRDVSPFDHSRIHLQLGTNDYINASLITVEEAQRSYILTQGPLPNTCGHFWEMVWEQGSIGVVMLNRVIEKGSVKCAQYWPSPEEKEALFHDTSLKLTFISEDVKHYYTVRQLELKNLLTEETRNILHFHYTTWPDFGVPESPASFLNFLLKVRESGCLDPDCGPVVVHCSAGIGRSGTFCLVDTCLLLMSMRDNPTSVRIREVLLEMRRYRMGLIQTADQLRFSYLAVIEGSRWITGGTPVQESWKSLSNEDAPPACTPGLPRSPPHVRNGTNSSFFPVELIHDGCVQQHNDDNRTHSPPPEPFVRRRRGSDDSVPPPVPPRPNLPDEPAPSTPRNTTAPEKPDHSQGSWTPLVAKVCLCAVVAMGAYICYRTWLH